MWDRVTVPAGITGSLNAIFSAVLTGGIDKQDTTKAELLNNKLRVAQQCRPAFVADFPFNIFYDGYAIFYEILCTLRVTEFDRDQLELILENNRDLILDSPYVNKKRYSTAVNGNLVSDDDILSAISSDVIDLFIELSNKDVTEEQFKSASTIYRDWYKNILGEFTAHSMAAIMTDQGYEEKQPNKRTRIYRGLVDMQEYYNSKMRVIKALSEDTRIRSTVLDEQWLADEADNEGKKDEGEMFDIGIENMDKTIGKLRRGNMLGVMGPPKGGKTRFCVYLAQRALSMGYSVAVWPLEGTKKEWESMILASYIANKSYEDVSKGSRDKMLRVSSKDIIQRSYSTSSDMRKTIIAAKQSIALEPKRGRLSFIEGTAFVEDMFDILQSHYDNDNKFDVLIIDQLVNVMSKKGKGKVERISEAYMETKNFIANKLPTPALGIMPAQLKQEVVDQLRSGKVDIIDVTAGGESAETARTPDEVVGLFSSKHERENNIMKIYSVASRHNANFEDFQARCYLECCYFMSENDEIQ